MKNRHKIAIYFFVTALLLSPLLVDAATNSSRIALVNSVNPKTKMSYGAMDACATDGTYIYVLKHHVGSTDYTIASYDKKGNHLNQKYYTAAAMDHPNGLTYYNGYLYIAPIEETYVIRIKVSAGKFLTAPERVSINLSKNTSGITVVGAITHYSGNDFIIRGRGNTYGIYTLGSSFTFKKKLTPNTVGESFNTIQDIFYYNGKLFVVTWRREGTTDNSYGRANRIVSYNINATQGTLTYRAKTSTSDPVIRVTGGTASIANNKFELEGGCVIAGKLYYVTNDQNKDSIYGYDVAIP